MKNYFEIFVNWEKKRTINESLKNIQSETPFIFQIYGKHLHNQEVLLFIGAANSFDDNFIRRTSKMFAGMTDLQITIGHLDDYNGNLEIPISILIANHHPLFNKRYQNGVTKQAKNSNILVVNQGSRNLLEHCCTNYWWVNDAV
jgi:hypothetical protein